MDCGQTSPCWKILIVEDNSGDALLIQEAFLEVDPNLSVQVVKDCDRLFQQLEQHRHQPEKLPTLVLMDINLPGRSGVEALTEMKNDPIYRRIPVVVLTSSSSQRDIEKSYDNYANAYVTKPSEFGELVGIVRSLKQFWLDCVLPAYR
jgi:two-component system, chemotaxis family, response regulator Rcp1